MMNGNKEMHIHARKGTNCTKIKKWGSQFSRVENLFIIKNKVGDLYRKQI